MNTMRVPARGATRQPLLRIKDLTVAYGAGPGAVVAVDGVDLQLHRGEALGVVGESGSGKSTLAHTILRLLREPAQVRSGEIWYHPADRASQPVDVLTLDGDALRKFRWSEISVVLQSAMNALNPVLSISAQLGDVLRTFRPDMSRDERRQRAGDLLETVGVNRERLDAYPHELSGGMRQRAMIAMALALEPSLVVMDEPTTALDVITQRQILQELASLREKFGFALVFITHDLSLLLEVTDTIAVMYAGQVVELASSEALHHAPAHPYSDGLLNSFPPLTGPRRELVGIPGFPPDMANPPAGCRFHPRCPNATEECTTDRPPLVPLETVAVGSPTSGSDERLVACIHDLVNNKVVTPT